MHAAAITVLFLSGICSEPCADDCGACCRPKYSFCESWRHFWCGIAKPCNCHINDWPLEYAPGPGETDYRQGMNYPWSNQPSQPPVYNGYSARGPQRIEAVRPVDDEQASCERGRVGQRLISVLKPNRAYTIQRPVPTVPDESGEAIPMEALQTPPTTRR